MIATVLLIFIAVFLGTFPLVSAVVSFRDSARLKRRLQEVAVGPAESGYQRQELLREVSPVEQFMAKLPIVSAVRKQIDLSGLNLTPLRFLSLAVFWASFVFFSFWAWKGSLIGALLTALASAYLPFAYLSYLKKKRSKLFGEQLPEALTMIARSLRAGHTLASAVELIGEELPDPAGTLFKLAYDQQKLGMRISDSLRSLVRKVESMDYRFLVTIIRINNETGGSLAEILEKLAETIKSRQQIRRQVKVYTAEGRLSGYILVALPVVVFAMFSLLRPSYMEVFFTQRICQLFLGAAVLGQLIGFFVIRKIIDIRI